ncbi:hypothetical protein GCM10009080_22670 [Cupriavidus pauculus]
MTSLASSRRQAFRQRIAAKQALLVPGAFNAMSARVIEDLGFQAVYLTGAGVTNMSFGLPDLGFVGLSDMAEHTARVRDAVTLPLIVDADTGFGNALNVHHAVRTLERAGADAIQLEDQVMPKKCGHFSGKQVVSAGEMVGKIHAATDARGRQFPDHRAHRCGGRASYRGRDRTRLPICRGGRRYPVP